MFVKTEGYCCFDVLWHVTKVFILWLLNQGDGSSSGKENSNSQGSSVVLNIEQAVLSSPKRRSSRGNKSVDEGPAQVPAVSNRRSSRSSTSNEQETTTLKTRRKRKNWKRLLHCNYYFLWPKSIVRGKILTHLNAFVLDILKTNRIFCESA